MARLNDPRLETAAVRARYNDPTNYTSEDVWHQFTGAETQRQIIRFWRSEYRGDQVVLDAGSGDIDLRLQAALTINLDISETRVCKLPNAVIGSVEAIPLHDSTTDIVVCVGSVLNYCDAGTAISEFARILRPGGYLLLEFESSRSAELRSQDAFGRSVGVAETFYGDGAEIVWVYTPEFVRNLLEAAEISVFKWVPIHVLSPWVLSLFGSISGAAIVARLDPVARFLPIVARWASNHLFIGQKRRR
jgi:ubiquinone/menaquinone biosynthesis C-methylase UbiE